VIHRIYRRFQRDGYGPVSTAILKGLLTPMVKYAVNFVNAPVVAKEMGIKVTESTTSEAEDYTHLITCG
jgi:D-3-phosphoglycerate dehydrogenase